MAVQPPPADVLAAFAAGRSAHRLDGGQGQAWRADDLVLKPGIEAMHAWLADAFTELDTPGVRVATPVPTVGGEWTFAGWSASRWLEGAPPDDLTVSWVAVVEAGRAFHDATAQLPRPEWLAHRDDWWSQADRAAWGEAPIEVHPSLSDVADRLQCADAPTGRDQVVHGDLTGNVLLAPGLEPAIIDISPYWRPPAYAEAVVLADALCWHDLHADAIAASALSVDAVARALLFRLLTTNQRIIEGSAVDDVDEEARRYRHAATVLGL